jgi:hypothetical protein
VNKEDRTLEVGFGAMIILNRGQEIGISEDIIVIEAILESDQIFDEEEILRILTKQDENTMRKEAEEVEVMSRTNRETINREL